MNDLTPIPTGNVSYYRASTDAAALCRDIVTKTAQQIQGRRFVSVEGWMAIAVAHGCAAGSRDVEKVEGGVRAIGEVRRMDDGQLIATAEGFVGEDEPTWYGGKNKWGKEQPKRPDYAIRAMAQTRAISRACRSAFAHVVVMIDAGLSTTPAEEVPHEGFDNGNVIDVHPAGAGQGHTQGEAVSPDRPKRDKLDGPYTSATQLKTAIKAFVHSMNGCGDWDEWVAYRETAEVKDLLEQVKRDKPDWWEGYPDAPPEFVPLHRQIELHEARLANQIADIARA